MTTKSARILLLVMATLLFAPAGAVFASGGLTGDCADCHTMHNSYQGQAVAKAVPLGGTTASVTTTPIQNLLKYDCIACHAYDPNGSSNIVDLANGSQIPQVWHADASGDLAGGNFRYIAEGGNRKGHNVVDLVSAENAMINPPGFRHADGTIFQFDVSKFTCAGQMGCHGMRGQLLKAACDPLTDPECTDPAAVYRTGLAALSGFEGDGNPFSGAHHASFDGVKGAHYDPNFTKNPLATSYRFIRGLRGYGNEDARWQNVDSASHNEYVGGYAEAAPVEGTDFHSNNSAGSCMNCHNIHGPNLLPACNNCHVGDINGLTGRFSTPANSMTGFCVTCHSDFHSSGDANTNFVNGSSGAFLRHPSDYVIPNKGEYANYTQYDITAPVARPHSFFVDGMTPSSTVTPESDLVMCLSCHVAHASQYDSMLRFDYANQTSKMVAGSFASIADAQAEGGCLACHTSKGVLPEDRD